MKAGVYNRVGDFGLLGVVGVGIGAMLGCGLRVWACEVAGLGLVLLVCCVGLLLAVCSKSALVGLHSWLLDAMEGPTPVSALLHSATLVCAGVVVMARWLEGCSGWGGFAGWAVALG